MADFYSWFWLVPPMITALGIIYILRRMDKDRKEKRASPKKDIAG